MERTIVGLHRDLLGNEVAELSCGHDEHVGQRHGLPAGAHGGESRAANVGTAIACTRCDLDEIPERVRVMRTSADLDESSVPPVLLAAHQLAPGTWGRVVVAKGKLLYQARSDPAVIISAGQDQVIPPEVEHRIALTGPTRFHLEFLTVVSFPSWQRGEHGSHSPAWPSPPDDVGDAACWAHLLCPECGVVLDHGGHLPWCRAAHPD